MPFVQKPYDTHFYCALCGGPFAGVYRTSTRPASSRPRASSDDDEGIPQDDPLDVDTSNNFNVDPENNRVIPPEVVEADMSYAAQRSRRMRIRAEAAGQRRGCMSEPRVARQAYDGRRISTRQMKWTRNLRALIHHRAIHQPANWQRYFMGGEVYLTGRGLVRESENWADAFASVDELEDNPSDEFPVFAESDKIRNTYGFHMYQELGGKHVKPWIGSIPFHDECWTLLDLAIEETGREMGLKGMNEKLDPDHMWGYLRSLITVSGMKREAEQTRSVLHAQERKEIITRLGEVDYREAQAGGEGWHWKHEDGCHWLAADPSAISVRDDPLVFGSNVYHVPSTPRASTKDPFGKIPTETIVQIFSYLSSSDIFSLKIASPVVHVIGIPPSYYRRFLREEFKYIPRLLPEVEKHEALGIASPVSWRLSFERLRRLIAVPRISGNPEDEDYGNEWDDVDICLKNRARIWKIVKPIAETLVETSSTAVRKIHDAHSGSIGKTSVVRGYVGVRRSSEGKNRTVYVGSRRQPPIIQQTPAAHGDEDEEDEDEDEDEEDDDTGQIAVQVVLIRLYSDNGIFCGVEITTAADDGRRTHVFGKKTADPACTAYTEGREIAGFAFCFADGIVTGAQLFLRNLDDKRKTDFRERVGSWNGAMRKITIPPDWRKFVGLTGFVNSAGFIETIGILEENGNGTADMLGMVVPPSTVPLSHDESSLWRNGLPPTSVMLYEREGADVPDWRTSGSEWEIWQPGYYEDGVYDQEGMPFTPKPAKGRLREIRGYYDEQFLRGLEFIYVNRDRSDRVTSTLMGKKDGWAKCNEIKLAENDAIIAAVINYGDEGVHGIIFVTGYGQVSVTLGPRYLGKHKVFAPRPDHRRTASGYREQIDGRIHGLHGLYDYEDNRFLQLGIILSPEEQFSSTHLQPLPCAIPFDEQNEQLGVWDDGPPPDEYIIGENPRMVQIDCSNDQTQEKKMNDYSGWVRLFKLKKITFYRNMRGIKFEFCGGAREKFFGNIYNEEGAYIQEIDVTGGERVIGVAVLEDAPDRDDRTTKAVENADIDNHSITSATSRSDERSTVMPQIRVITDRNYHLFPPATHALQSEYLVGLKFDFKHDQILSWAPIFHTSGTLDNSNPISRDDLTRLVRFPWQILSTDITADREIPAASHVISTLFADNSLGSVNGVKGYSTRKGRFCGLSFRRNGAWQKEPFGVRTDYETTFLLEPREKIDSIFVPQHRDGKISSNALAVSTTLGRTSPWFGELKQNMRPYHITPGPGQVAVGIFGAQLAAPKLYGGPEWDQIGLLSQSRPGSSAGSTLCQIRRQLPKLQGYPGYYGGDFSSGIKWLHEVKFHETRYQMNWAGDVETFDPLNSFRTVTTFPPEALLQLRVYSSSSGISRLSFRCTPKYGTVVLGEWPEARDGKLSSDDKIKIDGPGGERITKVKVARDCGKKVIGISVETNRGRKKTVLSPKMSAERPVELGEGDVKVLEVENGQELAGLYAIAGKWCLGDLGLVITRDIAPQLELRD